MGSKSLHVCILIQSFALPRHPPALTLSRSIAKADNVAIARKVSRDVQHSFKASGFLLMGHPGKLQLLEMSAFECCLTDLSRNFQSSIAVLTPSALSFARCRRTGAEPLSEKSLSRSGGGELGGFCILG